jgi:hypothetical protein
VSLSGTFLRPPPNATAPPRYPAKIAGSSRLIPQSLFDPLHNLRQLQPAGGFDGTFASLNFKPRRSNSKRKRASLCLTFSRTAVDRLRVDKTSSASPRSSLIYSPCSGTLRKTDRVPELVFREAGFSYLVPIRFNLRIVQNPRFLINGEKRERKDRRIFDTQNFTRLTKKHTCISLI